ncbi:protein kinase [Roseiconus nitratireducens]|uniref:Protein kinase n=1 Tax=Roseiconus nitratireducens TaxID=2605748 RepID=A0A5M6DIY5_9BACT|nr:serine/threonine-protein kinase [Roseiconus nitratireducens]KAA5545225.1 protein kinase [Roseiconus nitratireducens]
MSESVQPERRCPSAAQWEHWFHADGQSHDDENVLLDHLESCVNCQRQVDQWSADDPFHAQSREILRNTGLSSLDWGQHAVDGDENLGLAAAPHEGLILLVQSLLAPSETERSLGRLGRFEVMGIVGSGGMGIVLKARSIDVDRVVAIKIPQPHFWQSSDALLTLEREARSAAAVVHPNVIAIYHIDRYRDLPYLVMPYLPGDSLQRRIHDGGALGPSESLRILRQIAAALAAAHRCGVVHRDVKPANVLLGAGTDRVVLTDFGLAKVQSDATCTATGTFAGTPIYLSPEQARGVGAGPAGDVYSLGTVLWTMLCGRPPLAGLNTHAIVRRIADSDLPNLRDEVEGLPDWLYRLIDLLHAPVPADRPSASQIVQWVQICEQHLSDGRSVRLPPALESPPTGRRRRWAIAGALIAVVSMVSLSVWMPPRSQPPPAEMHPEKPAAEPAQRKLNPTADTPDTAESASQTTESEIVLQSPQPTLPKAETPAAESPANKEDQSRPPLSLEAIEWLDQTKNDLQTMQRETLPRWDAAIDSLETETGSD